ncbi:MAG: hypothetical protein AB7U85_07330 [Alphaproteobacteria bacterium]
MFIKEKDYIDFKITAEKLQSELEKLRKLPFLVGIEDLDDMTTFIFCKDEQFYAVDTIVTSNNLEKLKQDLLNK